MREGDNSYVVAGSLELAGIDDLFGVRLDDEEATTIGGLVTKLLGRIPRPGEVVVEDGLRFEVLKSTDRLVETLRISRVHPVGNRQSA